MSSSGPLDQQLECIMNVSEGRDRATLHAIGAAIESVPRAHLLDVDSDADHHRTVLTFLGDLESCPEAAFRAIGEAVDRIDLRTHRGVHPRIGSADVVPFVPIRKLTLEQCVNAAGALAARVAETYELPVFLYEFAARRPERSNLALIRQGGLDSLRQRMASDPAWAPDFGPGKLHPSAGACVIGVRRPLIAFNIFLESKDLALARQIARRVRESSGGLKAVKALGLYLEDRGRAQVSMNLTDFRTTSVEQAFDRVQEEARRLATDVHSSQLIGLAPREAFPEGLEQKLRLENFSPDRLLENRIERILRAAAQ